MQAPEPPAEIEIAHGASGTRARIAPARGGMATSLEIGGRAIFFLDRESFLDPGKNVRGGSPVLFPSPGRLAGDAWARGGASGALPQHGFARNLPWAVAQRSEDALTLVLGPGERTRPGYPWDFRLELAYRAHAGALAIAARIENRSASEMPCGLGFHPYFAVRDKASFRLSSSATRAYDNVARRDVPFDAGALDLAGGGEIDLHLLDHGAPRATFSADDLPAVTLEGSSEYTHWVLWSLPGRSFVCVEPWTCPANALNTGERLLHLAAGATRTLDLVIRTEAAAPPPP